jgi:polar amino acid transport system substrate-binding protein
MLRRLAFLFSLALAVPASAQPAKPPADLVAPGKLTYGTAATFAPFEYQENGQYVGFDIEFGAAIAKAMGLAPAMLDMDFNGLIPALQGKRVDLINSAMYINPARARQVDFIPYMRIGNEIIVRKGNPLHIAARSDLCGHRVAVTLGAIEETYARAVAADCAKAGKPALVILSLPTAQDSALAVRQGRADAEFDSTPGAVMLTTNFPDAFEIAGAPFETHTLIGIAVRKDDPAMKEAIEAAVHVVVANGTYAALMAKYHLPAAGSLF